MALMRLNPDVLMDGPRRGATTGANRRHGRAREMTRGNGAPLAETFEHNQFMAKSSQVSCPSRAALSTGPPVWPADDGVHGIRVAGQQKKEKTESANCQLDMNIKPRQATGDMRQARLEATWRPAHQMPDKPASHDHVDADQTPDAESSRFPAAQQTAALKCARPSSMARLVCIPRLCAD